MLKPKLERGLVQIYTGEGKGKTSAALGLALRAMGHGFRVWFLGFGAPPFPMERFSELFHYQGAADRGDPLIAARQALIGGEWDLVILDQGDRFAEGDVLELMALRPSDVELVITGRVCPAAWLKVADLVTEARDLIPG